jgi:hypothetical protein
MMMGGISGHVMSFLLEFTELLFGIRPSEQRSKQKPMILGNTAPE